MRIVNKYTFKGSGIYIGRPSVWGNPFAIGRDGDRKEVIRKYELWIREPAQTWLRVKAKVALKGQCLICYCAPLACHGDVLAKIALEEEV